MIHPRVGGDAAKQRKVAALQNEVAGLEAALEAARREYERVKARNLQVSVINLLLVWRGLGLGLGVTARCGQVCGP